MFAAPAMDAAPCMAKSRLADCAAPLVGLMPIRLMFRFMLPVALDSAMFASVAARPA